MNLKCFECSKTYDLDTIIYTCIDCGGLLEVVYDKGELLANGEKEEAWKGLPLSVWKYYPFLPIAKASSKVTLNEGGTALHITEKLSAFLGLSELFIKNEGGNPTGSFKDRGMTITVTKARELGASTVICASTGNTSASLSAYGARGGLKRIVLIPTGKVAYGKLSQAMMCGANVIQVQGNFDNALEVVMELSRRHSDIYLVNSINPFRIEGQKTLGYEMVDQLGGVPDWVIMPVGNAGNISAVWKGLLEFREMGFIDRLPKMVGVQAEGSSPVVNAFESGGERIENLKRPETVATAIRIGAPVSWKKAIRAMADSGGTAMKVSDDEILAAQGSLARLEGIFVEPASASPVAALKKLIRNGTIARDERVVCVATGHGLKDPEIISRFYEKPIEVPAKIDAIEEILDLKEKKKVVAAR
ncbi:MAG: threonine synthase [Nitrososphaerales archaeon]